MTYCCHGNGTWTHLLHDIHSEVNEQWRHITFTGGERDEDKRRRERERKRKRESREKGNGEKGKITCTLYICTSYLLIKITNLEVAQFNFFGYKFCKKVHVNNIHV